MWATTGNELEDVGNGIKNLGRGLLDAAIDLVDGVFSLALYLVFGGFVFSGAVSLPDVVEERCKDVDAGIQAILKDPLGVIEAMGQSMTDTYEEEGLAYAVGYISLDVIAEIAATKGAGGAKGAAKAADTAADAARAAKKVDTVADAAGAAKKVDTVADAAGAAKKVDTVTDAAKAADKATDAARAADKVSDAAGAAKKVDTVTDAAGAAKKADTATDAAGAVYTVDKVEETADAAKKVDGLEVKGGTAEVETIPEVNLVVENSSKTGRVLSNGQSLDDMAKLYAEKVNSNNKWSWMDDFPDAGDLSKADKVDIKNLAIEEGLISDVPVRTITDSSGKTYRYADFDAAGLVKEKVNLPEHLWSESDAVQFKWLDDKIGGRPEGYTWHHSEVSGQMELVPTGIHNIYNHNGGRTVNHWAYREGGR